MLHDLTRRTLIKAAGGLTMLGQPFGGWEPPARPRPALAGATTLDADGAPADGIQDDLPAFTAAFKATPAGGVMHIPMGTYRLSGPLLIDRTITLSLEAMTIRADQGFANVTADNVSILGAGGRKTVINQSATWQPTGNDHWNLQVFGVDGFSIEGVGFDIFTDGPTVSITTTGAIIIRDNAARQVGSTNFEVTACWFRTRGSAPGTNNRFFGIFSGPPVGKTFNSGGRVLNNVFQQCKGRNVEFGYTRNAVAMGNVFLALGEDGAINDAGGIAFRILAGENISVIGNVIEAPATNSGFYGININGNWLNRNIVVSGNVIRSSAALGAGCYGMRICNARGISIVGNRVWYEGNAPDSHGILVYTNKNFPCDNVLIDGNWVEGWQGLQIGIAENAGVIATGIVARNNHTTSAAHRYGTNNPDLLTNRVDFSEGHRQTLYGWSVTQQVGAGITSAPFSDGITPRGRLMPRGGSITALAVSLAVNPAGILTVGAQYSRDGGATWRPLSGCEVVLPAGATAASMAFMPGAYRYDAGDLIRLTMSSNVARGQAGEGIEACLEIET